MARRQCEAVGSVATYSLEGLPAGWRGTLRTLQAMRSFVLSAPHDPGLRDFALHVVRHVGGHQFAAEQDRLFYFVRDSITYRRDPVDLELVQDARRTLQRGAGDCDDKVVLLSSLLSCLGHRSRFVIVSYTPPKFAHVYLQTLRFGSWLHLDPTSEKAWPGWSVPVGLKLAYPVN